MAKNNPNHHNKQNNNNNSNNGEQQQIQQYTLKGHRGSVLSLSHTSSMGGSAAATAAANSCCLLSGSEDGTARLWDLRTALRANLCIIPPPPPPTNNGDSTAVNSVAFGTAPTTGRGQEERGNNNSSNNNFNVYLSVGSKVFGYDLRMISSPIFRGEPTYNNVMELDDEVNQLSFSLPPVKGNPHRRRRFMAAASDCGVVKVVTTTDSSIDSSSSARQGGGGGRSAATTTTLPHADDDGVSMVTSAVFRPRFNKGMDLVSGGTDCCIKLWDITKPKRPSSSFHVNNSDGGANQVCNPPLVHSMSWSPSGRLLAGGLGDGSCIILKVEGSGGRTLVEAGRLWESHASAVACVGFPNFFPGNHVASEDRLLVTAGNDGALLLWDLGEAIAGSVGPVDPSSMFAGGKDDDTTTLENKVENMSLTTGENSKVLFGVRHSHKPNWLVNSGGNDQVLPATLFVADTSNDITAYMLPTR